MSLASTFYCSYWSYSVGATASIWNFFFPPNMFGFLNSPPPAPGGLEADPSRGFYALAIVTFIGFPTYGLKRGFLDGPTLGVTVFALGSSPLSIYYKRLFVAGVIMLSISIYYYGD